MYNLFIMGTIIPFFNRYMINIDYNKSFSISDPFISPKLYKKKMWYDCQWDNYPHKTKMTQILTTIGHRTAFNNEQSPYRIVSYKRSLQWMTLRNLNVNFACCHYLFNDSKNNLKHQLYTNSGYKPAYSCAT